MNVPLDIDWETILNVAQNINFEEGEFTARDIATRYGISYGRASTCLRKLEREGRLRSTSRYDPRIGKIVRAYRWLTDEPSSLPDKP